MQLNKGDKVGIVACSNPLEEESREEIRELILILKEWELEVIVSPYIYGIDIPILARGKLCGETLMNFYQNTDIKAIFDISGGNIANDVLEHLDYKVIRKNPKPLIGYSDLTCVINSVYSQAAVPSILYQIRNICKDRTGKSKEMFYRSVFGEKKKLYDFSYEFIQGNSMEGIVVGGNIRCFLKLAGTSYLPNVTDKILLIESCSGDVPLIITYLNQLKQMGVFQKIKGIILGTFTEMMKSELKPEVAEIILQIIDNPKLPIAKTNEVGHSKYSKAVKIGEYINL